MTCHQPVHPSHSPFCCAFDLFEYDVPLTQLQNPDYDLRGMN